MYSLNKKTMTLHQEHQLQAMGICTQCLQPFDHDIEEPFASCACGTTEWSFTDITKEPLLIQLQYERYLIRKEKREHVEYPTQKPFQRIKSIKLNTPDSKVPEQLEIHRGRVVCIGTHAIPLLPIPDGTKVCIVDREYLEDLRNHDIMLLNMGS
jgi:hypothetical protein